MATVPHEAATTDTRHGPSRGVILLVWVSLTLLLIPAMALIRFVEKEVSQYHTSTFEPYAREALEEGDFERVLRICNGAFRTSLKREDHWGKVYLLRAQAHAGLGEREQALDELEACADFWTRKYFYATGRDRTEIQRIGTELGVGFLAEGDRELALRAFSATGLGCGAPVEYLHELASTLSESERAALWDGEPYLVVRDFERDVESPFEEVLNEQRRVLEENVIEPAEAPSGTRHVSITVSESKTEGRNWYAVQVHIPLSREPFGLRVVAASDEPCALRVFVGYWFELARQAAVTTYDQSVALDDNWRRFDVERDFYAEREAYAHRMGYTVTDGIINRIGLDVPPGPANRFRVASIELYLPSGDRQGTGDT